jgi:hypothetical protein
LFRVLQLRPATSCNTEAIMNEEVFNTSIRKFLKRLGVTAQREIDLIIRDPDRCVLVGLRTNEPAKGKWFAGRF